MCYIYVSISMVAVDEVWFGWYAVLAPLEESFDIIITSPAVMQDDCWLTDWPWSVTSTPLIIIMTSRLRARVRNVRAKVRKKVHNFRRAISLGVLHGGCVCVCLCSLYWFICLFLIYSDNCLCYIGAGSPSAVGSYCVSPNIQYKRPLHQIVLQVSVC